MLRLDGRLSKVATERANDMVRRAYFGHVTPEGRPPWDYMRAGGCAFHYAAENIAQADGERDYSKIGIGVAINGDGSEIFVEDFTD